MPLSRQKFVLPPLVLLGTYLLENDDFGDHIVEINVPEDQSQVGLWLLLDIKPLAPTFEFPGVHLCLNFDDPDDALAYVVLVLGPRVTFTFKEGFDIFKLAAINTYFSNTAFSNDGKSFCINQEG